MKAALLTAVNQPLEIAELEPAPLTYGQVMVRVLTSGICGAQLQEIRGEKGTHFPRLIGHEGCGIVESVGPGVKTVKEGDKVVMHWRKGDGIESDSPRYMLRRREITGGQVITFATHSVCSENRLTAVPDDAPVEMCALLGCGLSTAIGTIEQEAKLLMGETVLIIGCGGLGLNLILAAKMRQASKIVVIENMPEKMERAHSMGAHSARPGFWLMEDERYDVIIDTSGSDGAIEESLRFMSPSGRFIMVGQPRKSFSITNPIHMFEGEGKTIKATQGGGFRPHLDIPRYVRLHKAGLLNLDGIISHRVSLENINQGIDLVRDGLAGRVLIEP